MDRVEEIKEKDSEIVQKAIQHLGLLFNKHHKPSYVFSNFSLSHRVLEYVRQIATTEQADPKITEQALIAACFLPLGKLLDYEKAVSQSIRELGLFFSKHKYPEADKQKVVSCIQTVGHQREAISIAEKILSDAFYLAAYLYDFEAQMELLRLEQELALEQVYDENSWLTYQQDLLLKIKLYTSHAKINYDSGIGAAMILLRDKARKKNKKTAQPEGSQRYANLEKNPPNRGAQTLFRTNYRNHINLSAIADNKANIMISVNSILISVLITLLSYRNIAETNPMILLPVTLFLVTGLASLIFAVLSARPKVTTHNNVEQATKRKNIIFFGSFARLDLDEYEDAMDEVLRDEKLLYGNMVRDLYFLGKVLDKKYWYLTLSYNIFMMGFIITVGSFLYILFS